MEDKQNIYLDKVIEYLVRDTKIDYENEKISTSFPFTKNSPWFLHLEFPSLLFSSYSKEVYGLTDQEIDYVWDQYRTIIKDKINER